MKKNDKKRVKENPIMVNSKNIKETKIASESDNFIKSFIIIFVVIALLIGIIYGVTELLKKDEVVTDEVTAGEINYDKISVGTILNRPYDKYYVMVYNASDDSAVLYSTILTKYMQSSSEDDYIKIYYCDLSNSLNSKYYNKNNDNKSNAKVKEVSDFNFGDLTLLKIENGKITKYIEDLNQIKELLK